MTKPSASSRRLLAVLLTTAILAACGGGGGGGSTVPAVTVTTPPATVTTPPSTLPSTSSGTVTAGAIQQTATLAQISSGYSGSITVPAASSGSGASLTATLENALPSGVPAPSAVARAPKTIGGSFTPLVYVALVATSTVSFSSTPAFTFSLPAGTSLAAGTSAYVAFYNPASGSGWQTLSGPGSVSGQIVSLAATSGSGITLTAGTTYVFCLFTTFALITPTPSPTATATSTGGTTTAYTCPTSATSFAAARGGGVSTAEATRRSAARPQRNTAGSVGRLAVTYDRGAASSAAATVAARERNVGASAVQTLDFASTNTLVHVLTVPASQVASATAALRAQAGVLSVDPVGRRHISTVNSGYFPNDPYFDGFTAAQNTAAGNPGPSTQVGPYYETASIPGQWDMHVIGLDKAFAYSQSGNGSGITNAAALGSSNIKVAIIDTGEDPNHPELATKLAYQGCFITNPSGTQSKGSFSTDPQGHGTDVAGIAAADLGNGLGFAGAGGNVAIYGYRVFPTPDDNCANDNNTDPQCSVETTDIASAIYDAVGRGVNVISMSLGGGTCGTGATYASNGDNDITEGNAVAYAIAHNVIVVAAAGNDGGQGVEAPACDTGVIAVGASSIADGQQNGAGNSNGSGSPFEYVASYSDYGSPSAQVRSSSAWGIVAPGGDPSSDNDVDDLHWIENIWTSTPYQSTSSDTKFTGSCTDDYPNSKGLTPPLDCRTLIAGTSMATPHVAGAAALILSVSGGQYQSPTAMKQLLCQTADDISDPHEGCGRLNIYRAMATVLNDSHLP